VSAATAYFEPIEPGPSTLDSRRSWYCVAWPDGSCIHLHSLSALSALAWTRAENGAPPVKGKTVTADICSRTGQRMPLMR